jgi:gamma-glutamyltranspeptidase/glutathione hydrolase
MPTLARRGIVATSQVLAAQAGTEILAQGGNAVDAAIATAACMTVLEPTTNGIGGDAFALVWSPAEGGRLHGFNGSGRTPRALDRSSFGGGTMPTRGWDPVTVPGQVALWADLHRDFGVLPFESLMAPAAMHARDGYPVAVQTARLWDRAAAALGANDEWRRTFTIDGRAPRAGELMRLPDHARTLELLGASGGRALYEGDVALAIDAMARADGGALRREDLAAHTTERVAPISMGFRGARLHEIPPNGQGIAALIALALLERVGIDRHGVDDALGTHLAIEAIKMAFREAHLHVAEPSSMVESTRTLLDPARLDALAARIDPARAQDFVVPGTGIALQNRGACFNLVPGHANELAPGKRPYHTIIPGFLSRDAGAPTVHAASESVAEPIGPFGIMGGFMQPQAHAQYTLRTMLHGQNPQAALDAPRWQWMKGLEVQLEPGWPQATIDGLRARGHTITIAAERSVTFGRGQAIARLDDGVLCGASDLRGDGCAAGR